MNLEELHAAQHDDLTLTSDAELAWFLATMTRAKARRDLTQTMTRDEKRLYRFHRGIA